MKRYVVRGHFDSSRLLQTFMDEPLRFLGDLLPLPGKQQHMANDAAFKWCPILSDHLIIVELLSL